MTEKRFVAIDDDELYYITDTEGLKTVDDFIKEFSKPEYGFTEDEAMENAQEEYWQLIYEASMTATENVNMLNELYEENKRLKEENNLFFQKVFELLLKYQKSFNRKMADEVLEELGIELTEWFE